MAGGGRITSALRRLFGRPRPEERSAGGASGAPLLDQLSAPELARRRVVAAPSTERPGLGAPAPTPADSRHLAGRALPLVFLALGALMLAISVILLITQRGLRQAQ